MSIEIGKVIYSLLSENEEIKSLLNNKIFPLVANPDVTFPFIIYKRTTINPLYTKDLYTGCDDITLEIIIASNVYNEGVDIANLVRKTLDNKRGTYSNINIRSIRMVSADEDFIEDTYIQNLQFKITANG